KRTQRGQAEGFIRRIRLERAGVERDHGQADAVDRDALADRDFLERQRAGLDAQPRVATGMLACGEPAYAFDQAGERQRASRQGRRALDSMRLGPTRLDWTRSGMERFPHGYDWRKTSTRQWHAHRPGASVLPSSFIRTMTVGS